VPSEGPLSGCYAVAPASGPKAVMKPEPSKAEIFC
jgi:hypothetical protein